MQRIQLKRINWKKITCWDDLAGKSKTKLHYADGPWWFWNAKTEKKYLKVMEKCMMKYWTQERQYKKHYVETRIIPMHNLCYCPTVKGPDWNLSDDCLYIGFDTDRRIGTYRKAIEERKI